MLRTWKNNRSDKNDITMESRKCYKDSEGAQLVGRPNPFPDDGPRSSPAGVSLNK